MIGRIKQKVQILIKYDERGCEKKSGLEFKSFKHTLKRLTKEGSSQVSRPASNRKYKYDR